MACSTCQTNMLKEEEINDLTDAMAGLKLLKKHGIPGKGVKSIEDSQKLLRQHLLSIISVSNLQPGAAASAGRGETIDASAHISTGAIKDLVVSQRDGCRKLYTAAVQLNDHVSKIPQGKIQNDLYTAIPDTNERLLRARDSLESDEFSILVAGDTGSGKSSFLNLLLGEHVSDLLPVAHTSSTSAICEIRYGDKPAIQVREVGSSIFVDKPVRNKQHAIEEISKFSHQRGMRDEEFQYEVLRIYWPVDWLQHNIMIVDSPGVGENPRLTEMVKEYIPKASGFIYVINPTIDGGFSPEKMQDLLFAHLSKERRQNEEQAFDPASAIFVCNKWDDIKKNEKEEMTDHIRANLMKIWPGFSQDQLFFFSTRQTAASLKDKFVPDDYKKLLNGLERLLPIACQNRLAKHYWSLREVISRANFTLRLFLMRQNSEEQEVDAKCSKIMGDLDRLEKNQAQIKKDLRNAANVEVEASIGKLRDYLFSREVSDKLLKWAEGECPKAPRNPDQLEEVLKHAASVRILTEITEWETNHKIFEGIAEMIYDKFYSQFHALRAELDFIENYELSAGQLEIEYDPELLEYTRFSSVNAHEGKAKGMKTYQKILLGVTAPIWAPIGFALGLIALPVLGAAVLFINKEEKKKLKTYHDNKPGAMREVTRDLLATFVDSVEIRRLFRERITELQGSINDLLSRLPNIITANRKLANEALQSASFVTQRMKESCGDVYDTGVELENDINTIYLNQVKKYDIEIEDLEPWRWKTVGKGTFAVVYEATYKGKKVAVKKAINPASGYDSTDFILEETNFRKLKLPNVVGFFGTAVQKVGGDVYPILVLEHCQCSLDKIVLDANEYKSPGTMADLTAREDSRAYRTAARYCLQVSSALMSLHNLGYVHRDLKLENILIAADGRAKLADLGLSKPAMFITGTQLGTPLYMAPEVWKEKIYHHSADIFSLGLIVWEIWYGTSVIQKYQVSNLEEFKSNPFIDYAPPTAWQKKIEDCINLDPEARPTANAMSRFFSRILKESIHQKK